MSVVDRLWTFEDQKSSETVMKRSEPVRHVGRSGTIVGRWTVWNFHVINDERSETIAKLRSRFKNERIVLNNYTDLVIFFNKYYFI